MVNTEYRKISKFQKEYALKFDICIFLLAGKFLNSSSGNYLKEFQLGNFKVADLEKAQKHGARLLKIKAFAPRLIGIGKFVKAFFELKRSHVLLNMSTKDEYSSKFIFDETP